MPTPRFDENVSLVNVGEELSRYAPPWLELAKVALVIVPEEAATIARL
jgi:hypothetical protein